MHNFTRGSADKKYKYLVTKTFSLPNINKSYHRVMIGFVKCIANIFAYVLILIACIGGGLTFQSLEFLLCDVDRLSVVIKIFLRRFVCLPFGFQLPAAVSGSVFDEKVPLIVL